VQPPLPLQVFWASQTPLGAPPQVVPAARFVHPKRFTVAWHHWQSLAGLIAPFS
jgi:hypothetical protein